MDLLVQQRVSVQVELAVGAVASGGFGSFGRLSGDIRGCRYDFRRLGSGLIAQQGGLQLLDLLLLPVDRIIILFQLLLKVVYLPLQGGLLPDGVFQSELRLIALLQSRLGDLVGANCKIFVQAPLLEGGQKLLLPSGLPLGEKDFELVL